ncbi:hypothetical protein SAMN03159443_03750 [Pseudomonas sp. NFACC15-1]|uniref:hypothetical protein n=1 Tax=unclassified Pseudomonas TaxID=196821 RepID=UPI000890F88B|nr:MULTISPECIES: hypothetical protein [unclassified Pseudomonas]SDA85578.1 hypothetical protein SAMN03159443_03750 [Pseudomonas sp. NFACC15-1]SDW66453.1 hypothetical protein SAMN03159380_00945 [Pseudomonas sp. NFACC14]
MKSCLRTLGASLANSIVIPAAWVSGLATIGILWGVVRFWPDQLTVEGRQLFVASCSIFCLAIGYLIWRKRRAKALVASINLKEGLSLDDTQMLGYPSPLFFVFDLSNKKLAQCQSATGDYQVRDFTWVTGWQCEWQRIDSRVTGGVLQIVDGAGMSVPADELRRRFIKFSLVLTVADTRHSPFRFPMNRSAAEGWCTWCNVLFKC